jgi:hypothetical protein
MEPVVDVSMGKIGEGDSEKADYRNMTASQEHRSGKCTGVELAGRGGMKWSMKS